MLASSGDVARIASPPAWVLAASVLGCGEPLAPAAASIAITVVAPTPSPEPGVLEYAEVDELAPRHHGRRVKVRGTVTDDPILKSNDTGAFRFVIAHGDARLTVDHRGPLPDRFQPRLEVVIDGTMSADGTSIDSDDLVAKCPDSYETAPPP